MIHLIRQSSSGAPSPFAQRARAPSQLSVLIDRATLPDAQVQALLEFGGYPSIEIVSTSAKDGVAHAVVERLQDNIVSVKTVGGAETFAGLTDQWINCARDFCSDQPPDIAFDSLSLAGICEIRHVSAFVTGFQPLLENRIPFLPKCNATTPEAALALVGLYLRSKSDYVVFPRARVLSSKLDESTYFWALTTALLPRLRGAFSLPNQSPSPHRAEILKLAQAIAMRVERALRQRDILWTHAQRAPHIVANEQVLGALDNILVLLSAAFDAAALIINTLHAPTTKKGPFRPKDASWRLSGWLGAVASKAPDVADFMKVEGEGGDVLSLLSALRNTIHREGLSGLGGNLVSVPETDETRAMEAIVHRRGGAFVWGLAFSSSGIRLNCLRYLETLLPAALRALNKVMPHAVPDDSSPPSRRSPTEEIMFGGPGQERVVALAGLTVPVL